jgi:sodium/potassium-transporting ATPase subunit alpha
MDKNNQEEDRPAVIQFSDPHGEAPAETVKHMRDRLRRKDSSASHAIVAYRTLSITVSENQAKGATRTKKTTKDLAEGTNLQTLALPE